MLSLVSYLLFASATVAVPEPSIVSVTYSGNGCPQNTASYSVSPVNATSNSFQIYHYLDEFTPQYGASVAVREGLKQCVPLVDIVIDSAYKLRANSFGTSVNGYVRLAARGHDLRITANYTFTADASVQSISGQIVAGPFSGRFTRLVPLIGTTAGVESPCGGGALRSDLRADINARGSGTGVGSGSPAPDEDDWAFRTDVEVLSC